MKDIPRYYPSNIQETKDVYEFLKNEDKTHPVYGDHFMTKNYTFIHDNAIIWGYDNKKLKWEKNIKK